MSPAENPTTLKKKGGMDFWQHWSDLDPAPLGETSIIFTTVIRTHASNEYYYA